MPPHNKFTNRLYFLDNLRTTIIFLVILYHAGGVYESTGWWASFWIVDDPLTNDLVGILNLILDIIVMPTLFFISGYLTPNSLQNKEVRGFLVARFKRLMIPWLVAVLILIPLYKIIFLYTRNLPQEIWTSYFHFSSGNISSQSWLWFLPVLFLFNLLFVLLSSINLVPTKMSLKFAVIATFFIGFVTSFSMDILNLQGWTLTALIDFQNERLLLYFMLFLLGSLAFQQQIFATEPRSKRIYTVINLVAWIPMTIYIVFFIFPILSSGDFIFSWFADRLIVWLSFYLTLLCLLYLMIETFWRYANKPNRILNELNQNSYDVYIIHVIVLGFIALLLLNTALPSLLKYLILAVSTFVVSNILISLYRRVARVR